MRLRKPSTTFQSITPVTPRMLGLTYYSFLKYRDVLKPEECARTDPLDNGLVYDSLASITSIPQVDQYGLNGFNQRRAPDGKSKLSNWTICPNYDFCDGPLNEDVTQPTIYKTRWRAYYEPSTGTIKYGKKNGTTKVADTLLFPAALGLSEDEQISICFDANARASFAFQSSESDIQIRRFEASMPTTYQFPGIYPRLFYNGILQRNNTLVDIVCFYARNGLLCARFQRDNFAIERVLYSPSGTECFSRITKTDKSEYYQVIYYTASSGRQYAVRSMVYQPFPEYYVDNSTSFVFPLSGVYSSSVIITGPYTDNAASSVSPLSGDYSANTVQTGPYTDSAASSVDPLSGAYDLKTIQTGPYDDSAASSVNPIIGVYDNLSIDGGSYIDSAASTVQPLSGNYS
jgi:hypothetical protein